MNQPPSGPWGKITVALLGEIATVPGLLNAFSISVLLWLYRDRKGRGIQELQEMATSFSGVTVDQQLAEEVLRREFWASTVLVAIIVTFAIGSFWVVYRYVEKNGTPLFDRLKAQVMHKKGSEQDK
jgi:hypothetical protein